MKVTFLAALASTSLAAIAMAAPAAAQQTSDSQSELPASEGEKSESEIVVTGTQIRGIAPAGSTVIALDAKDVEASGASSGMDVLRDLPQIVNAFQGLPSPGNNNPQGAERSPVTRPNLRNIPNLNNSAGALTLVVVDGHRMVPQGIVQSLVDPESVPASLLQRVEALPDGASAIYGSDAVAGVINFVTRDKVQGVEATARAGFAHEYWSYDATLTAGHNWTGGGIFAALTYSKHDWALGIDSDYYATLDYNPLSPTYLQGAALTCANPNVSISTRNYALTGPGGAIQPFTTNGGTAAGGGGNRCDITDYLSFYPKSERIGVVAGLTQQLSDRLKFDVRVWWQKRENDFTSGPFVGNASIARTNPNYRPVPNMGGAAGQPVGDLTATQTVRFIYEPLGMMANSRETDSSWWQVSPGFTWDVSDAWQVRTLASYGESHTEARTRVIDGATQSARLASGAINPYNIGASAPGAFDNLVRQTKRYGDFQFTDLRVIADGPLFKLPGGEVRTAVGAEYMDTVFSTASLAAPTYQYGPERSASQNVWSLFGEVQVPIVGPDNAMPFLDRLSLSGSIRHDHYNDFGGTTNYSVGATLAPAPWIKFRGSTGTSFTAPSPVDVLGVDIVGFLPVPAAAAPMFTGVPAGTFPTNYMGIFLNGGVVGKIPGDPVLGPQRAKNWSVGFDVQPPFIPGLTVSGGYFNLKIKDQIGFPGNGSAQAVITSYPQYIYCSNFPAVSTTAACSVPLPVSVIQTIMAGADPATFSSSAGGASWDSIASQVLSGAIPINYIVDLRSRNLGRVWVEGLDYSIRYRNTTSWGGFDAGFAGNYELSRKLDGGAGTVVTNLTKFDSPRWRWRANAGVDLGGFRAQVTWQHTSGYDIGVPGSQGNGITGAQAPFGQTRVKAFNTVDIFLKYDFKGEDVFTKDLSLTLNVDNVLDTDPPFFATGTGFSPINGITLGRYFQIGISKKFR